MTKYSRRLGAVGAAFVIIGASAVAPSIAHDTDCISALLGADVEAIEPPVGWTLHDIEAYYRGWGFEFTGPAVREETEYSYYDDSRAEVYAGLTCFEVGDAYLDAKIRGDALSHERLVEVATVGDRTHATEAVDVRYSTMTRMELTWLNGDVV